MTTTTKVPTSNRIRAALLDIVQLVRPATAIELRAQNRVVREFDLEDLESIRATQPPTPTVEEVFDEYAGAVGKVAGDLTESERMIAISEANRKINAAAEARFPIDAGAAELTVTERGAAILVGYLDRAAEWFPAGKTAQGVEVPAGIPAQLARTLRPLVEALAQAFPDLFPEDESKDVKAA